MRVLRIVLPSPRLHLRTGVLQTQTPVQIQALLAETPVEALDQCVIRRRRRLAETQRNLVEVRPQVSRSACELRAVIDPEAPRTPALDGQFLQDLDDLVPGEPSVDTDRQALPGEHVQDGQQPDLAAV